MHVRRRWFGLAAVPVTALGLSAATGHGVGAQPGAGGGSCALQGTAQLSPGLGVPDEAFTLSLSGSLSGCPASAAGGPSAGTIGMGSRITVGGTTYQLPPMSGTGDCALTNLNGPIVISWSDGGTTVIQGSISGFGPELTVYGTVITSVNATVVSGSGSSTISTTHYQGDTAAAELGFVFTSPAGCASSGASQATVAGPLGIGGAS